ncbi:MAG: leucyl aminopeptidase [Actinomycetota bacterium]
MPLRLAPSQATLADAAPDGVDAVVVVVTTESVGSLPDAASEAFRAAAGFEAKPGQTLVAPDGDGLVIAVGAGGSDDLDLERLRRAVGDGVKAAKAAASVAVQVLDAGPLGADVVAGAAIEAALLSTYSFTARKGSQPDDPTLDSVTVVAPGVDESVAVRARAVAEGAALTRELVNEPGGSLTAPEMADRAEAMAADRGLDCEIWDLERLREERCGGILAVNQGSTYEPRLIKLTWEPEGEATGTVVLVGKGITFDTGGYSLKPPDGMMTMKNDMGGGGAVIGAMSVIPAIAPSVRVVGIVCATDNMVNGHAQRPGDVFTARNGTTVEVLNTDAEGRLVLADGLSLAAEMEPDAIVDLATLTGACLVALGQDIAGLMGNDDELIAKVAAAAEATGEPMWHLPLPDRYREQLDSDTADLKNIGKGRYGGTLTAGLFLREFVGETSWVHLDIAGPVTVDAAKGEHAKGGTGYAVRTLTELIASW